MIIQNKSSGKSKSAEHFDRVEAKPIDVAKAVLNAPSKKKKEWRYKENLDNAVNAG